MESVTAGDRPAQATTEDVDVAKERIRKRGERIYQTERQRALRRLREREDLSEQEERVVRTLAAELTEQLLAVPQSTLDAVADSDTDDETARVAMALFGEE